MKKLGFILLILVSLIFVYIGFTLVGPWLPKKAYPVEAVLPEGPLLFMSMKNTEKNIGKFAATKYWQKIQAVDYKRILEIYGAKPEDAMIYENFKQQLSSADNQKILGNFFGQEIAIAVYPMEITALTPQVFQEMATSVFFVTRLKPEAKFAEFISGFMSRFSSDVQFKTIKYKNHTITVAGGKNESLTIGYVSFNNLLVFGIGDKAAKACVDVAAKTQNSLAEDKLYIKTKNGFLPGAEAVSFINFDSFASIIKNQVLKQARSIGSEGAQNFEEQFNRSFRQMQGFQSIGYSSAYEDFIKIKVDVHFDKAKLDPAIAQMYSCPPGENKSLEFIPQNTIGYQWNNCYNLKNYWQQAKNDMAEADAEMKSSASKLGGESGKSPEEMVNGIEQSLGLSIENDIIPAFGDEFGGSLTDIKMTDVFPIPQLFLFVKTADQKKADFVIDALLSKQPMVQPQTEKYNDTEIRYVSLPLLVINLEPGYAYLDKYLVLATDRQLLKQVIDTRKNSSGSLKENPKLKEVDLNLADHSNSTFYLDIQQLMQKVEGVVSWSVKWAAGQDTKREAFKAGSEKRLSDLEVEIKTQETELSVLQEQLQAQEGAPVSDTPGAETGLPAAQLNEQIEKKEQDIQSNRQKAEELKSLLTQYSQPVVNARADVKLLEELVKPLIQAFEFWRVFTSTSQIKEGLIETKIHLNIQ